MDGKKWVELAGLAEFEADGGFRLHESPFPEHRDDIPLGRYELPRRSGEAHLYRLHHALAEALLQRAKERPLAPAEVHFDYAGHDGKISLLEPYRGQSGWLTLTLCSVESLEQGEDHLVFAATTDDGLPLDHEAAARLFTLPGKQGATVENAEAPEALVTGTNAQLEGIRVEISQRNARLVAAEADKLDAWADDLKVGLEREIKEIDRQIREERRGAAPLLSLEEKLAAQKRIKSLTTQRTQKRRALFDEQDRIDAQRDELIGRIEAGLEQAVQRSTLFAVRWYLD